MSADDPKMPPPQEESPEGGDSREACRARNRAKMDAARERARLTVDAMRERRQRRIEGLEWEGEMADRVVAEISAGRVSEAMTVEQAIAMFDAFDSTKH